MRLTIKVLFFTLVFVLAVSGQSSTEDILSPSATDLAAAEEQDFEVFKILPRGMLDYEQNELRVRGGGAYYSFVKKSHNYNEIPQLQLEKNDLSVGFYGASYGFLADLGKISLADVGNSENKYTDFLLKYKPKKYEPEAREEYRKINKGFEIDGLKYNKQQAATVGHTYILRAISYREADTLVAFQIHRKDADGSLIIFWKLLENFETPQLVRDGQTASIANANLDSNNYSGNLAARIEKQLRKRGFTEVKVSEEGNLIVLRGTIPKGKLSEVLALTAAADERKPIANELTEK